MHKADKLAGPPAEDSLFYFGDFAHPLLTASDLTLVSLEGDIPIRESEVGGPLLEVKIAPVIPGVRWEYLTLDGRRVAGRGVTPQMEIYKLNEADQVAYDLTWGLFDHAVKFRVADLKSAYYGWVGYLRLIYWMEALSELARQHAH